MRVGLRFYLESLKKKSQQHLICGIQRTIGQKEPAGGAGAGSSVCGQACGTGLRSRDHGQPAGHSRRGTYCARQGQGPRKRGASLVSGADGSVLVSSTLSLVGRGGRKRERETHSAPCLERVTQEAITPRAATPTSLWEAVEGFPGLRLLSELSGCTLGALLLPLHSPLALRPPGPAQAVPSLPAGAQRGHEAVGRYVGSHARSHRGAEALHHLTVLRTSGARFPRRLRVPDTLQPSFISHKQIPSRVVGTCLPICLGFLGEEAWRMWSKGWEWAETLESHELPTQAVRIAACHPCSQRP